MFYIKLLLTISIADTCWLGWQALNKPDAYVSFHKKSKRRDYIGRMAFARLIISGLTVYFAASIVLRFSLSFLPFEWGRYDDGDFMPLSHSLAGMAAIFVTYLICTATHKAGVSKHDIESATRGLTAQIENMTTESADNRIRNSQRVRNLQAANGEEVKKHNKELSEIRKRYNEIDQKFMSTNRELSRLKNMVPAEILSAHEEQEIIEREKEAALRKPRIYYS